MLPSSGFVKTVVDQSCPPAEHSTSHDVASSFLLQRDHGRDPKPYCIVAIPFL